MAESGVRERLEIIADAAVMIVDRRSERAERAVKSEQEGIDKADDKRDQRRQNEDGEAALDRPPKQTAVERAVARGWNQKGHFAIVAECLTVACDQQRAEREADNRDRNKDPADVERAGIDALRRRQPNGRKNSEKDADHCQRRAEHSELAALPAAMAGQHKHDADHENDRGKNQQHAAGVRQLRVKELRVG